MKSVEAMNAVPKIRREATLGEYAVALLVLAFLAYGTSVVLQDIGGATRGLAIPATPPNEMRRCIHPLGLSIVLPENWDVVRNFSRNDVACLFSHPEPLTGSPARRSTAFMMIGDAGEVDHKLLAGFQQIEFQGQPAYEHMVVERKGNFDRAAWSRYHLYTQRENRWYCAEYCIAQERTELPEMVRKYIETIRWPHPEATRAPAQAEPEH